MKQGNQEGLIQKGHQLPRSALVLFRFYSPLVTPSKIIKTSKNKLETLMCVSFQCASE
jgi:hypothetical protein